jgi:DNA-binding MarR family transcriptional regulator
MLIYDMRMSDRFVFEHIRSLTEGAGGEVTIVASNLAVDVGCHRNTASRICKRLSAAGMIERIGGCDRTGYTYRLGASRD